MAPGAIEALEAGAQRAEDQWRRGNLAAALAIYRSLLLERLTAKNQRKLGVFVAADIVIIDRLADLAMLLEYDDAAHQLLTSTVELYTRNRNHYGADYTTLKCIHLALERGLLWDASKLLKGLHSRIGDLDAIDYSPAGLIRWEQACVWPDANPADRAILFSRLYLVIGRLLVANGRYGQALAVLDRGLLYTEDTAPALAQAARVPFWLAIAGALLERGNLEEARAHLARLESHIDDIQQPGFAVHAIELAGKLALLQGEFGTALRQFAHAQSICQARGFPQAAIRAALNLTHIAIYFNQTSIAGELLDDVQLIARRLGDTAALVHAELLLRVARARSQSLAEAVSIAPSVSEMWGVVRDVARESAVSDWNKLPDFPESTNYLAFFEDRALGFQWQLGREDLTSAARILSEMRGTFGTADSALIQLRLSVLEGMLAYYQQRFVQAEQLFTQAHPSVRTLGLKPELWQIQRFLGWCAARLERPTAEQVALSQETDALLASIADSLSASDRAIFLLNKWTAEEEFFRSECNQLTRMKRELQSGSPLLRPWRRFRMLRRLNMLMQRIDRYKTTQARRSLGQAGEVAPPQPISLWRRLLSHPRDRATIAFLVLPDRVLVTRAMWLSLDFGISPMTRIQTRNLVRRWHELVANAQPRRPIAANERSDAFSSSGSRALFLTNGNEQPVSRPRTDIVAESKAIARHLAEGLRLPDLLDTLPDRIRALTIVPEDSLHGFPFAAALHKGHYLVEHYALSIAFERSEARQISLNERGIALAVGISHGTGQFPPLPGTQAELDQVEAWLARQRLEVRRLMNESASKATVLNHLPNAALLHIACHGVFQADRPDNSGLVLMPDADQIEILSLRELSHTNLARLRHVTLSSCWSADHFVLPGRWIVSLPETLWRAGAQSILGCLWEVNDRLAVAFMRRFYDYLSNFPRDEALHRTQMDCLRGDLPGFNRVDTANPLHWAGYTLYGDYRMLRG